MDDFPLVTMIISCFDRTKENPLPVYNKYYWLDWSKLSAEESRVMIAHACPPKKDTPEEYNLTDTNESIATMSVGSQPDYSFIRQYRHLFSPVPDNNIEKLFATNNNEHRNFTTIPMGTNYFETELGEPITRYEMIKHVSESEEPIILGLVESVLALGVSKPKDITSINENNVNTISQFLEVIELIYNSPWNNSSKSISTISGLPKPSKLVDAKFPDFNATNSVLPLFRQLHASDKLLENTVSIYIDHCSDDRKVLWIKDRLDNFNHILSSTPIFPNLSGICSIKEVMQMFMYGARTLHSHSNPKYNEEEKLNDFIKNHGKEQATFIFNTCLQEIYNISAQIYHPIEQDFSYWIKNDLIVQPTRAGIADLFTDFKSNPA